MGGVEKVRYFNVLPNLKGAQQNKKYNESKCLNWALCKSVRIKQPINQVGNPQGYYKDSMFRSAQSSKGISR